MNAAPPISALLRDAAPKALGVVMRRYRDLAACEDAVQEALLAAATQWPEEGVPTQPVGWLVRVATRRLTDQVRAEAARRRREALVVSFVPVETQIAFDADRLLAGDDTLVLLFMCCHPSLTDASAIALTLRAVGGLTTAEIARAFLVPEATMAQRISRAKQTIKASSVPFELPAREEWTSRLGTVLHVIYLVFNEGYAASSGSAVHRTDLAHEAIRLGRLLHALAPEDTEVAGLLALMLLTDARRVARTGPHGELVPLDEQDRSLWDGAAITEGVAILTAALRKRALGPYQLQAAIAAVHDEAASTEKTDWPQILALYDLLLHMSESPVVALNRVIAVAMVQGAHAGLEALDAVARDERLGETHRVDAVRAHLLERSGSLREAIPFYEAAAARTGSIPERDFLRTRAARLRERTRA